MAGQLLAWRGTPSGPQGFPTAGVNPGGGGTGAGSSKTMGSQGSPGVYFAGEVMDASGHLGGLNFQGARASGYS
ncbi:NAD(P)/FAD-dependent oxidoreductase, partial [Pseudomonas aeruginosa]